MSEKFRIPYARFFDADEKKYRLVVLPGAMLMKDSVHYDAEKHDGKLSCPDCDAAVHYSRGAREVLGGMISSVRAHFRTNRGEEHTCPRKNLENSKSKIAYDTKAGWRISLAIGSVANHDNARRPFFRDKRGHIVSANPELSVLKPYAVHGVNDIVKLMMREDFNRVSESVILRKGFDPIQWGDFFIRYNRQDDEKPAERLKASARQVGLTDTLLRHNHDHVYPALMEMRFSEAAKINPGSVRARVLSRQVFWGNDGDGKPHFIQPQATLLNLDNPAIAGAVPKGGVYLVLGYVHLTTTTDEDRVVHTLNINVSDPGQIMQMDVADLANAPRRKLRAPAQALPAQGPQ